MWVQADAPAPPPRRRPAREARRRVPTLPEDVAGEVRGAVGAGAARRVEARLAQAVEAYENDRYQDALRHLKAVAKVAPTVPAVQELLGLTQYRLGRWSDAIPPLEAVRAQTGSLDQHPVLADCHRALGHWEAVEDLWDELRRASPSAELVAEGRMVAAGALADRGDLEGAIRLLERSPSRRKRARPHDLRVRYALADLYERAGDLPRARALLEGIAESDPGFVDVAERLAALS